MQDEDNFMAEFSHSRVYREDGGEARTERGTEGKGDGIGGYVSATPERQ